jgi:hypothetical protein
MAQEDQAMSIESPTDAEAFYSFLGNALSQGERDTPPEALVRKWRAEREFEEACEDIREGLAGVEAGRIQSLEQFDAEFRARNGLPARRRA